MTRCTTRVGTSLRMSSVAVQWRSWCAVTGRFTRWNASERTLLTEAGRTWKPGLVGDGNHQSRWKLVWMLPGEGCNVRVQVYGGVDIAFAKDACADERA